MMLPIHFYRFCCEKSSMAQLDMLGDAAHDDVFLNTTSFILAVNLRN